MKKLSGIGYCVAVCGVALLLIWIGLFKFTPTEAKAIRPLMDTSPFLGWMYHLLSQQAVSNLIGVFEIITGLLLLTSFKISKAGLVGGIMAASTFMVTLSFLFTTPGINGTIDGIWMPDQFILKDLVAFGVSLTVVGKSATGA